MNADSFASLGLSPFFLDSLAKRNITAPTEIQRKVIPRLLSGESLIFRSATGTGKTFAYLLPLLERLLGLFAEADTPKGKPLLVIAAPTYELCSQIKDEADFLLKAAPRAVHTALLIGQASAGRQAETLKKDRPELIVGNPGRILALARSGKLKLRAARFLVLDEGDRLTGDELYEETAALASLFTSPFQGVSCSATVPAKSRQRLLPLLGLAPGARNTGEAAAGAVPSTLDVEDDPGENVLRDKVEHWALFSPGREKIMLLRSLIAALTAGEKKAAPVKVLIFTGRAGQAEGIAARLRHYNIPAAFLSGGMEGSRRKQSLAAFRSGKTRFLVSSDLAARGLDIAGVSHVIALDVSEDRDVYIHRAGRTARAGKGGVMVSIGTEGEMRRLAALEKNLRITVYPKVLYGGRILAPAETEE